MCGSLTSSDSHGRSAHLFVFAKYIQSVDGGNLAPLLQRRFFTAPYPLLNIGIENLQKQICSNDGNLAPPQTEQLSMLKEGAGMHCQVIEDAYYVGGARFPPSTVCIYRDIHTYMHTYIPTCLPTYIHTYIHTHACMHGYIYIYTYTCTCEYLSLFPIPCHRKPVCSRLLASPSAESYAPCGTGRGTNRNLGSWRVKAQGDPVSWLITSTSHITSPAIPILITIKLLTTPLRICKTCMGSWLAVGFPVSRVWGSIG